MNQQQKAAKLMINNDRITELPDVILSKVISLLPLKEAIRTSILSKSWSLIWINHPDIIFDAINILGSSCNISSCCVSTFIKRVNKVMFQRSKGPKMDSIAIRFPLVGQQHASHNISQWISCAVRKGVEKIDLDLSDEWGSCEVDNASSTASEQYTSPCWLLASPGKAYCMVKHLQLTSCSFSLLSISNTSLASQLVTVDLRGVNISDEQLEGLLSTCLCLERMVLRCCDELVNFKLTNPSSKMKLLTIQNCSRIKNIQLYAENLEMLEYTGHLAHFSFKNVPKLAQVFLCFTGDSRLDGVTYALYRIGYDVPQLKTLNLISILAITALKLPEKVPAFDNIKQLVLSVCPFQDEDELCWISYILKAFPLLNKLQLNLFSPSFIKQLKEMDRQLPECHHKHLKELEINGYYGNQHELELLKYLVDSAFQLDVLVVNPCQKVYKGFNNWDSEEANPRYKLSMDKVVRLHQVVPSTVQLKIF